MPVAVLITLFLMHFLHPCQVQKICSDTLMLTNNVRFESLSVAGAVMALREETGEKSRPRGEEKMGYQKKLPGLVLSTSLLSSVLLGVATPVWAVDYKQAPTLDEQVKAGKLPSVA